MGIHIALWEPSKLPQRMIGQFGNVLVDKSKNQSSDLANKQHGLSQAITVFCLCLT